MNFADTNNRFLFAMVMNNKLIQCREHRVHPPLLRWHPLLRKSQQLIAYSQRKTNEFVECLNLSNFIPLLGWRQGNGTNSNLVVIMIKKFQMTNRRKGVYFSKIDMKSKAIRFTDRMKRVGSWNDLYTLTILKWNVITTFRIESLHNTGCII